MKITSSQHEPNRLRQERVQRNWRQQDLAEQLDTTVTTIKRWERGSHQPSAYFRIKLCALFGKSAEELGLLEKDAKSSTPPIQDVLEKNLMPLPAADRPALWTVPYRPNPHFTGRDGLLALLDRHLSPPEYTADTTIIHRAALTQPQAIRGLGGIGKTQIAVEYAYRARRQDRYTHTFWVNAASEEAILNSLMAMAQQLPDFPAREETNRSQLAAAIKHWLEQCPERWLLIFDNADNLVLLPAYLPSEGKGSILLTTRATAVSALAVPLDVPGMDLQEGLQFLLQRTQRLHTTAEERNNAIHVVIALDGFPLALDQAGAYIEETRCSFGDYLHLYQDHHHFLLARRGRQMTNYPESVATTWALSFQKVEATNPAAADLLRLCAFLQPDIIPEALIQEGAMHWPPPLQLAASDLLLFNQMVESLLTFSLIKRLTEKHLFSVHRLVQVVLQDAMSQEHKDEWIDRVIRALEQVFPVDSQPLESWTWCEQLVPHITHLPALQEVPGDPLVIASLWYKTARFLHYRSHYAEAEAMHKQVLALLEHQRGPEHEELIGPLIGLVEASWYLRKLEEATRYAQRAMTLLEQAQDTNRFALIKSLNILAHVSRSRGHFEEAERLLVSALTLWVRLTRLELMGPPPPHDLQEPGPDAATLIQHAFALLKQTSLHRHIDSGAQCLAALAQVYQQQQRYLEADKLLKALRQQAIAVLGEAHPIQATLLMLQGKVAEETGQTEQAARHYALALSIRETMLGSAHPHTQEAASAHTRICSVVISQQKSPIVKS